MILFMSTTIRNIADKAGVSSSTVSLVLNSKPGIGEETRLLVLETAKSLGYAISAGGRRRKTEKTVRFLKIAKHGHIINRDHSVFISDYIDGIEKEGREHGFSLEVRNYGSFDPDEIFNDLVKSPPSGVVVLATELDEQDIIFFDGISVPVVFIDCSFRISSFDSVDMDNEGAVFAIIKVFQEMGHRNIGLVKSSIESRNFRLRERSFYEALEYFGCQINPDWTYSVDSTYEQSWRDMKSHLEKGKNLPTALFCVCDIIALGCLKAIREKGIRIPDDISVIGFDDLPSSLLSDPPLASFTVSKTGIGRRAFQLLKGRMDALKDFPREKVFIGGELILRSSLSYSKKMEKEKA